MNWEFMSVIKTDFVGLETVWRLVHFAQSCDIQQSRNNSQPYMDIRSFPQQKVLIRDQLNLATLVQWERRANQ